MKNFNISRWVVFTVCALSLPLMAAGPVIVLDPGHGGAQNGAYSPTGMAEKDFALALAKRLSVMITQELDATVVMTREHDKLVQLQDRAILANSATPDIFLSIHANSMPTKRQQKLIQGIETYFLSATASGDAAKSVAARENAETVEQTPNLDTVSFILADLQRLETHHDSSLLAYEIHESLVKATGAVDRGVQQAPFKVLMNLKAPAALLEVGFISHPEESRLLANATYQQTLARAITQAVDVFLQQIAHRDGK